jgi:hypothetical protein
LARERGGSKNKQGRRVGRPNSRSSYFVNGPTCAGLRLRQGRNTEKTSRELKLCLKKVFIYFFYLDFAKIYGPLEFLQNYTYAVVVHGVRDITSWPTAVGAASNGLLGLTAACHDVRSLTPWAMAVGAYRQAAACPQVTPQATAVCMDALRR